MKRGTQKLTMDMFRSRTKTGKREAKNLLFPLAMRLTSEDIVERPKWLNAMEKVNPAKTAVGVDSFMAEKKGKITYPEDKLIRAYYNRRPLAKLEAIDMHAGEGRRGGDETSSMSTSSSRHFVRQFALRQLEYMNQIAQPPIRTKKHPKGRKYTEEEARVLVEKEAEEERRLLARNREGDENPFIPTLISKTKVDPNLLEEINKEEEMYWQKNKEIKAMEDLSGGGSIVGRFSRGATRKKREEPQGEGQQTTTTKTTITAKSSSPSSSSATSDAAAASPTSKVDV